MIVIDLVFRDKLPDENNTIAAVETEFYSESFGSFDIIVLIRKYTNVIH